jgi:hypothetical protein
MSYTSHYQMSPAFIISRAFPYVTTYESVSHYQMEVPDVTEEVSSRLFYGGYRGHLQSHAT